MSSFFRQSKMLLPGVVAAITYGMNPLFTLPLYQAGFSADAVLFCRYLPAVAMIAGWMCYRKESFKLSLKQLGALSGCGLLFGTSSLSLFLSYQKMDAGIASTLLFVYPVMTALLMHFFFKEKIRPVTLIAMGLALAGIALLFRRADGTALSWIGVLLTMISAATYAFYLVAMGLPVFKGVSAWKSSFYVLFFGILIFAVRLLAGCGNFGTFSFKSGICMVMLTLLPTILSLGCTFISINKIGSTVTAILGALEPLTAVFFGVLVFHEAFSFRIACGIVLILSAVVLIALCNHSKKTGSSV